MMKVISTPHIAGVSVSEGLSYWGGGLPVLDIEQGEQTIQFLHTP